MNFNEENQSFGFEPENVRETFNYNDLSGLGESNYENEDLFNQEVATDNEPVEFVPFVPQSIPSSNENVINNEFNIEPNNIFAMPEQETQNEQTTEVPVVENTPVFAEVPETAQVQEIGYSETSADDIVPNPTKWYDLVANSSKYDLYTFVCK